MKYNTLLTYEDIANLLKSMAQLHSKESIFTGNLLSPDNMLPSEKQKLIHHVSIFFGLDDYMHNELAKESKWSDWVDIIYKVLSHKGLSHLTFRTSGSTGEPCSWSFTPAEICEEAHSLLTYFSDRKRIISVMPIHHIFGFAFALMLPKLLGIPVLQMSPLPTADFFRNLLEGDLLLAFPVFWNALHKMRCNNTETGFPPDLHGVSSSAPCPPDVIEGLLGTQNHNQPGINFLSGMTEIYGATEFGAVGIRRNCRQSYSLLSHWDRFILDAPTSINGIDKEWGIRRSSGKSLPLPDEVEWTGERCFIPVRRKDKAVQVGGINVFPSQVADLLRTHPAVRDCYVRLMRPDEGVRLKAFVVPDSEVSCEDVHRMRRELKYWLAEHLDVAAIPKTITLGSNLPLTASGKMADW